MGPTRVPGGLTEEAKSDSATSAILKKRRVTITGIIGRLKKMQAEQRPICGCFAARERQLSISEK
jgi:hypothetical protein